MLIRFEYKAYHVVFDTEGRPETSRRWIKRNLENERNKGRRFTSHEFRENYH